jgi:hypothetical protein
MCCQFAHWTFQELYTWYMQMLCMDHILNFSCWYLHTLIYCSFQCTRNYMGYLGLYLLVYHHHFDLFVKQLVNIYFRLCPFAGWLIQWLDTVYTPMVQVYNPYYCCKRALDFLVDLCLDQMWLIFALFWQHISHLLFSNTNNDGSFRLESWQLLALNG